MGKALRLALIVALCVPLLSGCWDRTEINDIAIVLASSIDREDDGAVRYSVQLPLPGNLGGPTGGGGGGSGGSKSYYVDSETGRTVREASAKLQTRLARRLFLSHRRVLLIGEDFARDPGIQAIFDSLPRLPESRLTTYMAITKGKAYELLNAQPRFERFSSETIRELVKGPSTLDIKMKDIAASISMTGSDPVVSYLTIKPNQKGKAPSQEVEVSGLALFNKSRMVDIADREQMKGIVWLRNKVRPYTDTLEVDGQGYLSYLVQDGTSSIDVSIENGKPKFTIVCKGTAVVQESMSLIDLAKPMNADEAEKKMVTQIKSNIQKVLDAMQRNQIDIAAFGSAFYRKYPDEWNRTYRDDWRRYLADGKFDVQVKAHFSNFGLIFNNIVKEEPQ